MTTGDPKYTPINKLKPFEQAYHRHVGPFAPLYRLLGIGSNVGIEMLQEWESLLFDACSLAVAAHSPARWA